MRSICSLVSSDESRHIHCFLRPRLYFQTHAGWFPPAGFLIVSLCTAAIFFYSFFFKTRPHVAATPPVFAVKHLHSSSGHIHLNVSVYENTRSWFILYCLLFELALYFIPAAEIFSFPQHPGGIIDWHYEGFKAHSIRGSLFVIWPGSTWCWPSWFSQRAGLSFGGSILTLHSAVMGFYFMSALAHAAVWLVYDLYIRHWFFCLGQKSLKRAFRDQRSLLRARKTVLYRWLLLRKLKFGVNWLIWKFGSDLNIS